MSFSTIIVLGRYQSTSGPASGTVTFTRSALLRNTATGELLLPAPIVAHLDSEGILRIALAANNDPTTLPTGSHYTVQEAAGDCTRAFTISVPYDSPNGTLDLVDVATGSIPGTVSLSAVTGGAGGGGGDLTPPVTVNTTTAVPAPLEVVLTDAATTTAPPLLGLTHRAPAGGDVGLGAGLLFRMDRDDATLGTAAQLTAAWSDPAGTAQLLFRVYDGTPVTALTLTPFGCYLPAAGAEPPTPTAGVAVWSDAGVLHYKGPDGVPHATGGGSDPLAVGTDTFSSPRAGQHLSVYGAATDTQRAALFGSNDSAYDATAVEAYSGSGYGVYTEVDTGVGVSAYSAGAAAATFASDGTAGVLISTGSAATGPTVGLTQSAAGIAALQSNADLVITTATQGVVLTDRTSGTRYRLVVNNGILSVEAA